MNIEKTDSNEEIEIRKESLIDSDENIDNISVNNKVENEYSVDNNVESKDNFIFNFYNGDRQNETSKRDGILTEIEQFRDRRVYVTKKIRMNSEARLNKNNIHSIILVNVYTFTILCFSIFSITNKADENLELLGLIISLGLFAVSLFVSLFGYREKALAFKNSYLKIAEIEGELSTLLLTDEISKGELIKAFSIYQKRYNEILDKTDNHIDRDFIEYKYRAGDLKIYEKIKYIYYKLAGFFVWGLLYIVPIITMYLIISNLLGGN